MSGLNQLKRKRGKSGQVQTLWTLVVALLAGVAIAEYVANIRQESSLTVKTTEAPHHFNQEEARNPAASH